MPKTPNEIVDELLERRTTIMQMIVEMPKGTSTKFEIDKNTGRIALDRELATTVPANYGFLEGTLASDGDALDIFLINRDPVPPLTQAKAQIIGMFRCRDQGVQDDKVVAILPNASETEIVGALLDIRQYLQTYKTGFVVEHFENKDIALTAIKRARQMYLNDGTTHGETQAEHADE